MGNRSPRWAFMETFDIPDKNEPEKVYLRRLRILETPWFVVYLHWIYLPDTDRDPHDHPWKFISVILRGGYTERVWLDRSNLNERLVRNWGRFSMHRMPLGWAHKIWKDYVGESGPDPW